MWRVQWTLECYLRRAPWPALVLEEANAKLGSSEGETSWSKYTRMARKKYPGLGCLIKLDASILSEMTPEEANALLPEIFQSNPRAAIKHVRDTLARSSCGSPTTRPLEWTTNAKRAEAMEAAVALMRTAGMLIDWDDPSTYSHYEVLLSGSCTEEEEKYFRVRNAIEREMGLALTQHKDYKYDAVEDFDDRLLCEHLLQSKYTNEYHHPAQCREYPSDDSGWCYVHGQDEGGKQYYIPVVKLRETSSSLKQNEWLKCMWPKTASTSADFWVRRFMRLANKAEPNGRRAGKYNSFIHLPSYETCLELQADCHHIFDDLYADRLALLLLGARHDPTCALATHFLALRHEACKMYIKYIASFLTHRLPTVDAPTMIKAKFFDPNPKRVESATSDPVSQADWDAGCRPSVVYGAKVFVKALAADHLPGPSPLDVTGMLRPLLSQCVVKLHLNRLGFLIDEHLDQTIFATGQR